MPTFADPVVTRYALGERLAVMGIGLDLDRLSAIDDLWTAYLDSARPKDVSSEIGELDELAGQLVEALDVARGSVGKLRATIEGSHEEEIEFALQKIADRYPDVDRASRGRLSGLLEEYSFRGIAIEACAFLEKQLPGEIAIVEEKRRRLLAGEFQTGDMTPPARCALSGAKLGCSVLLVVMTGGAAAPMLLGGAMALIDLAENWEDGCGAVASGIWSRFSGA